MKSIFKLSIVLLFFFTSTASIASAEYTRQFRKAWIKNSVSSMKITNKFGEVKVNDTGGDSVTVYVVVSFKNQSLDKAKELMEKIHIDIHKSGNEVIAQTTIDDKFNTKGSFSIDYLINIPKDRPLDITNRYGNVAINELEAKGTFDISYGSMSAGKMKSPAGNPIEIILNYGKADLGTVNDAKIEIKYSKLNASEIGKLLLDSKYCTLNFEKLTELTLSSKYDAVNITDLDKLKSESRYTNYKIGSLASSFDLNTGYGSVQIKKVGNKFDKISITNSYGGINIGMNDLSYNLQADCEYCDIAYPTNQFKGNRVKEGHNLSMKGNVGSGGGTVTITSRYGGVKLME